MLHPTHLSIVFHYCKSYLLLYFKQQQKNTEDAADYEYEQEFLLSEPAPYPSTRRDALYGYLN